MFLLIYGIFLFIIITKVTVAAIQESWQLFFDVFPQFSAVLIIYVVAMCLFAYVRKVSVNTFFEDPKQRPRILWNEKIAKVAGRVSLVFYLATLLAALTLFPPIDYLPDFAKQWPVLIFSALATFTSIVFLFAFPIFLRLSNKQIVLYGLDYLSRIQGQDEKRPIPYMSFISGEVVKNLHELFLRHWEFVHQINLWPQFNVIFLGLICGNEKERTATITFLKRLYKMIDDGDDPITYRQIAEALEEFQISMKSLCELKDKTMLTGKPTIRRPVLAKIKEYAPIATIAGTLVALLAFTVQIILSWLPQ